MEGLCYLVIPILQGLSSYRREQSTEPAISPAPSVSCSPTFGPSQRESPAPKEGGLLATMNTHVVLHQIRVGSLYAVIQDRHHDVLPCVTSLPGSFNIHVRLAGMCVVAAVLRNGKGIAGYSIGSRQENHPLMKIVLDEQQFGLLPMRREGLIP